jgi:hypothetical protein
LAPDVSSRLFINTSGSQKLLASLWNRNTPAITKTDSSLDELFLNRVPARKFRTYQLKGIENTSQVRQKLHYDEKGIGGPAVEEVETNDPSKV